MSFEEFLASFSYFVIMFFTRYNFDAYKCTFQAKGFLHTFCFILYCLAVFIMSVNIAFGNNSTEEAVDSESSSLAATRALAATDDKGAFVANCARLLFFDENFATGFIASKYILLSPYCLYAYLLYKSQRGEEGEAKDNASHIINQIIALKVRS
jgi:hypothetical protein